MLIGHLLALEFGLAGLLIALPALADPNFQRSVALVCQLDEEGAMGVLVNRASEFTLGDVFEQIVADELRSAA